MLLILIQFPTFALFVQMFHLLPNQEPQEADASQGATSMAVGLLGAAVCGFMRSMPLEAPQLKTQVVDLSGHPDLKLIALVTLRNDDAKKQKD